MDQKNMSNPTYVYEGSDGTSAINDFLGSITSQSGSRYFEITLPTSTFRKWRGWSGSTHLPVTFKFDHNFIELGIEGIAAENIQQVYFRTDDGEIDIVFEADSDKGPRLHIRGTDSKGPFEVRVRPDNPAEALEMFKANRDF